MTLYQKRINIVVWCIIVISCHNLDIPLENFNPHILASDTCLVKTLCYPDTVVCTLHVEDLNDTALKISSIISDTAACWPGTFGQINCGYDVKDIFLRLPAAKLGFYQGQLVVADEQEAADTIPYRINRILRDTFNSSSPDTTIWKTYRANDIITIKPYSHTSWVLQFLFDPSQSNKSTGMRTTCGIKGDFSISIFFGIIELNVNQLNGVKVSFAVSTTSDTSQWTGIEAGLYLQGVENRLRIRAAKGFDSKQFDIKYYSGNMRIERNDTAVSLFCWPGDPAQIPEPIKTVSFSPNDSILYVHVRMSVESLDLERYCIWDNFTVNSGELIYNRDY